MAFEEITTTTVERVSYRRAFVVTGIFLAIIAILWYFQKPIQAWWSGVQERRAHGSVVELPPMLVAQPAVTPTPAPTPAPIYVSPASPTPTAVMGSPIPTSGSLPHTGPETGVLASLLGIGSLTGVAAGLKAKARASLKRVSRSPHVA